MLSRVIRLIRHALPLLLFAIIAIPVVIVWEAHKLHEATSLHQETSNATRQTALRLEFCFKDRLNLLEDLAVNWREGFIDNSTEFKRRALLVQQLYDGFQAINWINSEGVISQIVPEEGNEAALGRNLRENPVAGTVFEQAQQSGKLRITPPLDLYQGGKGFAAYLPVTRDNVKVGTINGVFRVKALVDACLEGGRQPHYGLVIKDGKETLHIRGQSAASPDVGTGQTDIRFAGRTWTLELTPSELLIAQRTNHVAMWFMVMGIALAALVALAFSYVQRRAREWQAAQRRSSQLLDDTRFAVLIHRNGRLLFANTALQQLTGIEITPEATLSDLNLTSSDIIKESETDIPEAESSLAEITETTIVRKDGDRRQVQIASQMLDYEGVSATMMTLLDISELRTAELALRDSEERYRKLFESLNDGVLVADIETGEILDANLQAEELLGRSREELMQMSLASLVPSDLQAGARKVFAMHVASDNTAGEEFWVEHTSGRRIPVLISTTVLGVGKRNLIFSIFHDLSQRKASEAELNQLAAAVEQAAEGILITDLDGRIEYINPAIEAITGFSAEEIIGENPRLFRSGRQSQAYYKELWETISRGDVWRGHFVNRHKGGSLYEMDAVISPVRDSRGRIVQYLGVQKDVTEARLISEQLRQAQKLEAVGQLAGGIAHDFNNLLMGIMGGLQMGMIELADDSPIRKNLTTSLKAAESAADLTRQLLALSSKQEPVKGIMDLKELFEDLEQFMRRTIPENIRLEFSVAEAIPAFWADRSQMHQVLLNLSINARDAMPQGGTLSVHASLAQLVQPPVHITPDRKDNGYVLVEVTDTGIGMAPEVVERIFEPFYSTKGLGKGTGLGLAMVYGILTNHEGWINVDSQVSKGTVFRIYLPLRTAEEAQSNEYPLAFEVRGSETILLVDDVRNVVDISSRMLERLGYTVLIASDGEEALALYARHVADIDVVVADVIMPNMGATKLLERLRELGAEIPVIAMSGYANGEQLVSFERQGFAGTIAKPFRDTELADVIRRVLA